jgi:hypothetical protein
MSLETSAVITQLACGGVPESVGNQKRTTIDMNETPYAEDINYWRTSRSSPDTWMDKTKRQIERLGGQVLAEGYGSEPATGRMAFVLAFQIGGDQFKVVWPALPSKTNNERAARIQAATMLYHDIKAKCISSAVLGVRTAFFSFLMLPNGRTAAEATAPELARAIPGLFASVPLVEAGEILESELVDE